MKHSCPVNVIRACGHNEVVSIRYGSTREKGSELLAVKATFCSTCHVKVKDWVASANTAEPYELSLPPLTGTPRQVSWAHCLRQKLAQPLLRAMTLAAEHGGHMGAAVWKGLYAVVTQQDASFWIDNREWGFNHYTVEREAGCFARGFDSMPHGNSIYSQIRKAGAHHIAEIELRCPVSLPSHQVAS